MKGGKNSFSKPIIRVSIVAITLGIAMMTLSLSIVQGFQSEIERKVVGFGSHIQITSYESKGLLENKGISKLRKFYHSIDSIEGVRHIQVFATKGAILKTKTSNYGVVVKGIDADFEWSFFDQYITQGHPIRIDTNKKSNELLISEIIAQKMRLNVGDEVLTYFVQQPPRIRKFTICGIYNTGLGEMDERMVLSDIRHIQKVNGWDENQVGGFEILIDNIDHLEEIDEKVYQQIDYDLTATSIIEARPDIFNWLELQDVNVVIIIGLLILVCGIDIISALLILILERTSSIGILKALGAKNISIRKIFIYNAVYLILSGLLYGNILGLGVALLQQEFGFLSLPQEAYFIDKVPIELDFYGLLLLNLGTLLCCTLMLIIPSSIIANISPTKAIRFD
jgi:lipoprotein-releasing system permease protein